MGKQVKIMEDSNLGRDKRSNVDPSNFIVVIPSPFIQYTYIYGHHSDLLYLLYI